MESNLKQIAQRRTDIFGAGDVETFIGHKIGKEDVKQPEKVTWDWTHYIHYCYSSETESRC